MPVAEKCETCKYFQNVTAFKSAGYCLRYPPHAAGFAGRFPTMHYIDWCGEYKAGPQPAPLAKGYE